MLANARTLAVAVSLAVPVLASSTALAQSEPGTRMGAKHTLAIDPIAGFRVGASGFAYAGPLGFARRSTSAAQFNGNGDVTIRETTFWLAPSADFFVIDGLSIGGLIELSTTSSSEEFPINRGATQTVDLPTTTNVSILPRVGYLFAISEKFGIWPRAGLGYASRQIANADQNNPAVSTRQTTYGLLLDLDVGFLYRPVNPVFFRFGPEIATTLGASHSQTVNGVSTSANASVFQFGAMLGVGVFLDL